MEAHKYNHELLELFRDDSLEIKRAAQQPKIMPSSLKPRKSAR